MNRITWLASYPKSGNTWVRIFLANLLDESGRPVAINGIPSGPIASARISFEAHAGIDSHLLTREEADALRPEVYRRWARDATEPMLCKIHDARVRVRGGRWLVPAAATERVLYIVRNPLDVAVSFAHHAGHSDFDRVVAQMGDSDFSIGRSVERPQAQFPQRLGSWSEHVASWIDATDLRVRVVRYEDLVQQPVNAFTGICRFLRMPVDADRIGQAIAHSDFMRLRAQEEAEGFRERVASSERFFRRGEAGSWRQELSDAQASRLVADHGVMMRRLGYLTSTGHPTF